MTRAGVPGFLRSPRHIDYIRAAYGGGDTAVPYRFGDPATDKPAPGDLLCFLRERNGSLSHAGLVQALQAGRSDHWKSHCEVVIAANPGGDRTLYLIGGNVANAVVMRKLPLNRMGRLDLPVPPANEPDPQPICSPGHEEACDFNQQDWAALLKLSVPGPAATP